jgi:tyrosinase
MRNVWSSINDPLFFMHHAQLDHVWWSWQNLEPDHKWAIDGPVYPNGTGGKTTLDSTVQLAPFAAPDVAIRDLMDSINENDEGVLCYVYQDTGHENPYDD